METTSSTVTSQFRLLIVGDGTVRTVSLHGARWIIGRAVECAVPLRDPTVSRRHLLLERHGNEFRFQDLGGSNPVLLDGRVANQGPVSPGQTLSIGMTRLTIRIDFDGERITAAGYHPDRDPIVQAKAQASWLQRLVQETTGRRVAVRPVIAFPDWFVKQSKTSTARDLGKL